MSAVYTTREAVKSAVDIRDSARANTQIDRLIGESSRSVDRLCHRVFYPWTGTLRFDWPDVASPTAYRLWLTGDRDLISLTSATSGGVVLSLASLLLYPQDGPPYDRIEIDRAGAAGFESGSTYQNSLVLTGLWAGAPIDEEAAATLSEDLDISETAIDIANSAVVGVGSVLRCDSERMIVTEKTALDTGADLAGDLTAEMRNVAVSLSTAVSAPEPGEMIMIDGERMLVYDRTGTTAYVTRAVDGTTLAAHSAGASVYAYRTLTVQRAALGTTAAAHTSGTALHRWVPDGGVEGLTIAETLNGIEQENSGYARVIGSGENQREARGVGLAAKRRQVYDGLARKGRIGAV